MRLLCCVRPDSGGRRHTAGARGRRRVEGGAAEAGGGQAAGARDGQGRRLIRRRTAGTGEGMAGGGCRGRCAGGGWRAGALEHQMEAAHGEEAALA